jgi:hypothetical protein
VALQRTRPAAAVLVLSSFYSAGRSAELGRSAAEAAVVVSFFESLRGMFSPKHREMQQRRRKAREELDSLLGRGLVEKVLMWPAEFGGNDDPRNVTYLPPALAERKRAFDAEVRRRVEAGEDLDFKVTPEYDSDSFVPARLHMQAGSSAAPLKEIIEVAPYRTWTGGADAERGAAADPGHGPRSL